MSSAALNTFSSDFEGINGSSALSVIFDILYELCEYTHRIDATEVSYLLEMTLDALIAHQKNIDARTIVMKNINKKAVDSLDSNSFKEKIGAIISEYQKNRGKSSELNEKKVSFQKETPIPRHEKIHVRL